MKFQSSLITIGYMLNLNVFIIEIYKLIKKLKTKNNL